MMFEVELAALQHYLSPWQRTPDPTYATDCFFYSDEQDMNATLPYCEYQHEPFPHGCCEGCKQFISRQRASDLILAHVNKKGETTD